MHEENYTISRNINTKDPYSPFATQTGFRVNHNFVRKIKLKHNICGGKFNYNYNHCSIFIYSYYIIELYNVNIEYYGVGSSDSKFKVLFKNKDVDIECNVSGSLDISQPNKFHLICVVDGTLYKSNVAFLENSIHLFNKVINISLILAKYYI